MDFEIHMTYTDEQEGFRKEVRSWLEANVPKLHRAEPDKRLRELEVRHPDAVARAAAVCDDEQDLPVGELADAGARVARSQLA